MFIAIVDFTVAPESRDAAVARLLQEGQSIRTMDGNVAFNAYVDPSDDRAIRIWHEWQDLAHFHVYSASETFRELALTLRPLMVAPPVSRRMTANILETVA